MVGEELKKNMNSLYKIMMNLDLDMKLIMDC